MLHPIDIRSEVSRDSTGIRGALAGLFPSEASRHPLCLEFCRLVCLDGVWVKCETGRWWEDGR